MYRSANEQKVNTNQNLIHELNEAAMITFRETGDEQAVERMKKWHESIFYGAPLVVIIAIPERKFKQINAGIAVENLAIAALVPAAFLGSRGQEMGERHPEKVRVFT